MFCPFEIFSSADALRQRLAAKAAKQRKEKENAASAIVEDASEVESEVAEVSNATEVVVEDEVANAPAQPVAGGKVKAETKWYQAMWFKGVLFFSIVPICFLLPFTIEYIVDYTRAYSAFFFFFFFFFFGLRTSALTSFMKSGPFALCLDGLCRHCRLFLFHQNQAHE
jgi:hypothetical protein